MSENAEASDWTVLHEELCNVRVIRKMSVAKPQSQRAPSDESIRWSKAYCEVLILRTMVNLFAKPTCCSAAGHDAHCTRTTLLPVRSNSRLEIILIQKQWALLWLEGSSLQFRHKA